MYWLFSEIILSFSICDRNSSCSKEADEFYGIPWSRSDPDTETARVSQARQEAEGDHQPSSAGAVFSNWLVDNLSEILNIQGFFTKFKEMGLIMYMYKGYLVYLSNFSNKHYWI